jgi:VWFA-related protein
MKSRAPCSFLALAGAIVLASSARPQAPPVFGVSADLVLIDLIATDADGRLVTDLRPDEIEVLEDGKRQRIELVRLVARETPGAPAPPASPSPADAEPAPRPEPQGATAAAAAPGVVVVVDLDSTPFDAFTRTREAILSTARTETESGGRLMLVTLERGLQVRQSFTSDLVRFTRALDALKPPAADAEAALAELIDNVERSCDGTPGGVDNALMLARAWAEGSRAGFSRAVEALGALARYLSTLSGRKHVVFYSAGYPMDPSSMGSLVVEGLCGRPSGQGGASTASLGRTDTQSQIRASDRGDATALLRSFMDEANRAQVSVYSVDVRGLMSDMLPAGSRSPTRLARGGQEVVRRSITAPQETLSTIADGTGGRASLNTNELARGMRAATADAHGYYMIGYAPPGGHKEGRFYPIEVKVKREGLQVRYRRGYEWLSDAKRAERAVTSALQFPTLFAEDGLSLETWIEAKRLHVAVLLPTASLRFREEGGEHRSEILLQALLRDDQGKAVGGHYLFSKTVSLKIPEARFADFRARDNAEIPNDFESPKQGHYQLTVVARHSGGRLAAATAEVEVP